MADKPLRILHLTLGADAGGLSRYIIDLGNAMIDRGHQVTVAGDTGAWRWAFDQSKLKYLQIPLKGGPISFIKCIWQMRLWLEDNPVDIIHTHYRRATMLGRRLQHDAHPNHQAVPLIYTVHLSHISLKFPRNLLSDFGDVAHVAAPEAKDWLIEDAQISEDKIAFISHGIPLEKFPLRTDAQKIAARHSLNLRDDDVVAIYVGRLDWPKNEEWLIDLADAARSKIPNLKILLIGEGPHESALKDDIAKRGLQDRVMLLGHRDPLACYQAADLLCLPSQREGFSFVCAEAMSVGVPILRTQTSGAKQLVIENTTGRSVPISREAFIGVAIEMLSSPPTLHVMGQNASRLVASHFTFDRQVDETIELYQRLLTR